MDAGPDHKRPRLGPGPSQWQNSPETSRQLPPPPPTHQTSYPQPSPNPNPFSAPAPHPHQYPHDRRHSGQHNEHPQYDHQDPRRPPSGQRNEPPPYDSQEPRRPLSGPSHGYSSHHGLPGPIHQPPYSGQREQVQRDSMVKRDPSDEPPQPQFRRSPPGNPQDHHVNPPPHSDGRSPFTLPPPPVQQHYGESGGPSPYRTSSFPPPSPMAAPDQYTHPSPFPGPPGPGGPYVSYPQNVTSRAPLGQDNKPPRKAQRAAQACDSCRSLKAKCDEGRPSCSSCREKGVECRYRDPPPKQQDKTSADMMDTMTRMETVLLRLANDIVDVKEQVTSLGKVNTKIDQRLSDVEAVVNGARNTVEEMKQEREYHEPAPPIPTYQHRAVVSESPVVSSNESPHALTSARLRERDGINSAELEKPKNGQAEDQHDNTSEDEVAPVGPPKQPSMPVNHTTGAAKLLQVPSIKSMIGSRLSKLERSPLNQELSRGVLRLYGRGEGADSEAYEKDLLLDQGSETTPGDTHSEGSSPLPGSGEDWGQSGGFTPPSSVPPEFFRGEIDRQGMPNFSREVVHELVESYKKNINNLHPILTPKRLDQMVDIFLRSIEETSSRFNHTRVSASMPPIAAGFIMAGSGRNPDVGSPGNKRKRSPGPADHHEPPNFWDQLKVGHPWRSTNSCIVLLVLALGKICLHKSKLPDVVPDSEIGPNSPRSRNGLPPSPLQTQSSPSGPMIPSPQDSTQSRSRRGSFEAVYPSVPHRTNQSRPKNIDVIPGLAYFAIATDTLGNQMGGQTLQHVQANLLAGLYHGQLARVVESYAYINRACVSVQILIKPKLSKLHTAATIHPKDNPLVFAFWTCLQLESDILAELNLVQSNILHFEESIGYPNFKAALAEGFEEITLQSYNAQLYLRKHLNQLHGMFYQSKPLGADTISPTSSSTFATIEAAVSNLETIRLYAPYMHWPDDLGEQATDILHARLRAKYHGARVITYRTFLIHVLAISSAQQQAHSPSNNAYGNQYKKSIILPDINPDAKSVKDLPDQIVLYVTECIRALANSTDAFHSVVSDVGSERYIVTNIWGTAHAQWGNLLVLAAAWKDPILNTVVEKQVGWDRLQTLFIKTIALFNLIATPSSYLFTDLKILQQVAQTLQVRGYNHPQTANSSSSFSSTMTG